MVWIIAHLWQIMTAGAIVGAVSDVIANVSPDGSKLQRVFRSMAHIFPMSVVSAVKTVTAPR